MNALGAWVAHQEAPGRGCRRALPCCFQRLAAVRPHSTTTAPAKPPGQQPCKSSGKFVSGVQRLPSLAISADRVWSRTQPLGAPQGEQSSRLDLPCWPESAHLNVLRAIRFRTCPTEGRPQQCDWDERKR